MKYRFLMSLLFLAAIGCRMPFKNNIPPASEIMHPGPGVDGPGPGVMMMGGPPPHMQAGQASQLNFLSPEGMQITWDVSEPGGFDSEPLVCPGRYNFPQGAIYRLKLTNIPNRAGVELFPTIEIGPSTPRTEAYLSHNPVPVQFSEEDFDQVTTGNFVTKVIYLPDKEFQDLAVAGVETLVSTRLDPGVDPIVEADRRGSIMAVIRLGNIDLMAPGGDVVGGNGIQQAGYHQGMGHPGLPPGFVSGVTAPQYGMPMSGTPIGLVGPPHVPHGAPAGLQKHKMVNHTFYRIPKPTKKMGIHVKHSPGFVYPKPPSHVNIRERSFGPPTLFRQSLGDTREIVE